MTSEEYERLCNKLTAVDSQSFDWERLAGRPIRIGEELVHSTGARTACKLDDDGNLVRRLPPQCPVKRAQLIARYWTVRLAEAERVHGRFKRRAKHLSESERRAYSASYRELKLCRHRLQKALIEEAQTKRRNCHAVV